MPKNSKALIAAASLSLATGLACADVRYDFTATSSIPFESFSYTGSFSVVRPDFIVTDTTIPAASVLACSAATSTGAVACLDQGFYFNISPGYDTVGFGVAAAGASPNLTIFYYFNDGDFSTPGLHTSQVFGSDQAGTLTVTLLPVPELASWEYAALGLCGLVVMLRRPKARKSV